MNRVLSMLFLFVVMIVPFSFVHAEETVRFSNEGLNGALSNQPGRMTEQDRNVISSGGVPNVTIDQATTWAEKKGFDVVHFLQKTARPFAIIFFIVCGIMAVFGVFGNGSMLSRGLVGAGIVAGVYAGILYAEPLLSWFVGWLSS